MADSTARSRCGRRLRMNRPRAFKLPETPLILAGALGGPLIIFGYTPLRNALTLASQDTESTASELYQAVFRDGFSSAWVGGMVAAVPACPQFCMMGPFFHMAKELFGSNALAVFSSALCETAISYSSQSRNAQMAYNQEQLEAESGKQVPLAPPLRPFGPGVTPHFLRNIVAMSGIRILSGPCQQVMGRLPCLQLVPEAINQLLGDLVASLGAAVFSMPLNQLFNFAVTSPEYLAAHGNPFACTALALQFLDETYLIRNSDGHLIGLSPVILRDLFLRMVYVALLFASFAAIERIAKAMWKEIGAKHEE
mmetsp:Transcript_120567/g.191162  ORF Transcript_120567/g.191162 Transcript_120567/m.191162 type:complete len:310 (-) Transcript_120567:332-1261(-)